MSLLNFLLFFSYNELFGRHGGLKVSALLSGSSGLRSSSGWGHWVLSIMPKILEISVGIQVERFVSVSFDRTSMRDQVTSGGGPRILVKIFRPKFSVAFLTNWFFGPN